MLKNAANAITTTAAATTTTATTTATFTHTRTPAHTLIRHWGLVLNPLKSSYDKINKYPLGTTMHPCLAAELTDGQICWAGLKHIYSHFRSGFTIIYGENYAFLSLFTKALPTDRRTDGHTLLQRCEDESNMTVQPA